MEHKQDHNPDLSNWLNKIQQDSWQLELIISGMATFLLIAAWQPIMDYGYKTSLLVSVDVSYALVSIFYYVMRTGYQALLFCLLVHLVLRGLWIAAIGLRSVSGDIDYDRLNYQEKYSSWLQKRIGTFDQYVERLERYCSIIFSLAFLILFCFLSLATFTIVVAAIQIFIETIINGDSKAIRRVGLLNNGVGIGLFFGGLIYLIDFFSFGFFKRNRYTAKPYYYLYRFMGWLTLARFYRPLYYNLIDQGFGRKLARFLPLFIVAVLVTVSMVVIKYSYFPYYAKDGMVWIDHYNYDDTRQALLEGQAWRVSLKSKYVENNYVEVFVPYQPVHDDEVIERLHPSLDPARYEGIKLAGAIKVGERYNDHANHDSLLLALTELQEMYVDDSLRTDIKPRFHFNEKRQQPGLLYMLPAHDMSIGEHKVLVKKRAIRADTLSWTGQVNIYFYK